MSTNILVSIGFILAGVLMIVLGSKSNKRCTSKTVGRITGIRENEETDDEGNKFYSYSPEYEYEVLGQIYNGCGSKSHKRRRQIQIGNSIEIYYNPNKPQEHYEKGGKNNGLYFGIGLISFGLILIFLTFI